MRKRFLIESEHFDAEDISVRVNVSRYGPFLPHLDGFRDDAFRVSHITRTHFIINLDIDRCIIISPYLRQSANAAVFTVPSPPTVTRIR